MKVLITGGSGFIGSNITLELASLGHEVTVLDNFTPQIHGAEPERTSPLFQSIINFARILRGNVCDESMLLEALEGQDAIIHLAAETGTGQSMYEIKRYVDVNIGGTALILNMLANRPHNIRKFVVASSRAVYGEGKYHSASLGIIYPGARKEADLRAGYFELRCPQTGDPLTLLATDEESKLHPTSVYGITKHNQEQMVLTVCGSLGIPAVALRYQNVYGPGQSLRNPYTGILSIFSTQMFNGNPINIFEDGKESRDFVYIDDVVRATLASLFRNEADAQVFGIGSGVPTSVIDVAKALAQSYSSGVPIRVTGAYRIGDIRHNYADTTKAASLLGFTAKIPFSEGIARFAAWACKQNPTPDSYDKSIREMESRGLFKSKC
jgi:dTDP-L-rhamnose 4-epimerase